MKFSCAGVCLPDFCVALGDYQDDDAKTGLLPIPGKAQSLDRKGGGAQSSAEQWEGSFSWTLVVKFCTCKPQTPVSLIFNMYLFKLNYSVWSYRKENHSIIVGSRSFFIPNPSLITDNENWMLEIPLGHPEGEQWLWGRVEGEDTVRMEVKTKILCYTAALYLTWSWGMCSYIPSFFPQIITNCLTGVRNYVKC